MADEETFRVTDRRRRAAESEPAPESPTAPAPPSLPETSSAPGRGHQETPAPETPGPEELAPEPLGEEEPDLQGVFMMFASSALIGLGAAPDPMTGERRIDLDQAQDAFGTLLLLRDKTEGNRTEAEDRVLSSVLHELELRFVRLTQGGPPPR
jgi:uncharacterized protein DUF1844